MADGAGFGFGAGSGLPPQPAGLPAGWVEGRDPSSGRAYYANQTTGEVTWIKPEPAHAEESTFQIGNEVVVHDLQARPELNGQYAMVEGWDEAKGRFTVRFVEDKSVVLALKVANLRLAEAPPAPPASPGAKEAATPTAAPTVAAAARSPPKDSNALPAGWVATVDPNYGREYYVNTQTGVTTWERPGAPPKPEAPPKPDAPKPDASKQDSPSGEQPAVPSRLSSTGSDGGTAGISASDLAEEATAALKAVKVQIAKVHEDAAAEERDDRGREHGAAQAKMALQAAEQAVVAWEARSTGLMSAADVGAQATVAMSSLLAQLTEIQESAASEELCDRGGGEHGGAQAQDCLDLAEKMLNAWKRRIQSIGGGGGGGGGSAVPPAAVNQAASFTAKRAPPPPPPKGFDGIYKGNAFDSKPELEPVAPEQQSRREGERSAPPHPSPPKGGNALPAGWVATVDPNYGREYYVNTQTGVTTWERPGAPPKPEAPPKPDAPKPDASKQDSPSGGQPAGAGAGTSAAAVAVEAAAAMRALIMKLTQIHDDASTEELQDRGGGEHGAAQAKFALDAAEEMLTAWERRMKSIA